jgi:hypothetical protein
MMTSHASHRLARAALAAALLAFAWVPSCAGSGPGDLTTAARRAGAPPPLERACRLADRRCTRCHPIDRVLVAPVDEPSDWTDYVRRMRLTPGSGISPGEEPIIVRCLVEHSFGRRVAR